MEITGVGATPHGEPPKRPQHDPADVDPQDMLAIGAPSEFDPAIIALGRLGVAERRPTIDPPVMPPYWSFPS